MKKSITKETVDGREMATSRLHNSCHNASETEIVISHAAWIAYRSSAHVKTFLRENVRPSFLTRSYFFQRALSPLFTSQEFPRQRARVPWREKIWQNAFRSGLNRGGEGGLECIGEGYSRGWEPVDRCDFHGTISAAAWFFSDSSRRDSIKGVADVGAACLISFFFFFSFCFLIQKGFRSNEILLIVVPSIWYLQDVIVFIFLHGNILGRRGNKRKMKYSGKTFKDPVLKINFHSIIFEKRDTRETVYFRLVGFRKEARVQIMKD